MKAVIWKVGIATIAVPIIPRYLQSVLEFSSNFPTPYTAPTAPKNATPYPPIAMMTSANCLHCLQAFAILYLSGLYYINLIESDLSL